MNWRLKGIIQKVLGVIPGGASLHYALQRRVGGLRQFEREFDIKIDDWAIMIRRLRETGFSIVGKHLFEIGSGWYPTFPLACYLAGAKRVTTVDLNRHLKPDLLQACIGRLATVLETIAQTAEVNIDEVRTRYETMRRELRDVNSLQAGTSGCVVYMAPSDATQSSLDDDEVDLIFSNSVLEHVPPEVINQMYQEAWRILAPGRIMFHSVNCGDHYAYVDRRINQLNYLSYSERSWSFWNNAFLYQNRLRAHSFVDRAKVEGFEIILDTSNTTSLRRQQLDEMQVDAAFSSVPADELCITTIDFIARKSA
jgi:SAM-dependent methyltransferase